MSTEFFRRLLKVAGLGAFVGNVAFFYYGGIAGLEMDQTTLKGQVFLYKDLGKEKGSLKPTILNNLQLDLKEIDNQNYTLTSIFYFDNKIDETRGGSRGHERIVVGAMMDVSQKAVVKDFINKHREYHAVITNDMQVLSLKFPYKDSLSFKVINWRNLYNKMISYGKNKNLFNLDIAYFIEQYPFFNQDDKNFEIMVPIGANMKQLDPSTLPVPFASGPVAQAMNS